MIEQVSYFHSHIRKEDKQKTVSYPPDPAFVWASVSDVASKREQSFRSLIETIQRYYVDCNISMVGPILSGQRSAGRKKGEIFFCLLAPLLLCFAFSRGFREEITRTGKRL